MILNLGYLVSCPYCGHFHEDDAVEDWVIPDSYAPHITSCDECREPIEVTRLRNNEFSVTTF